MTGWKWAYRLVRQNTQLFWRPDNVIEVVSGNSKKHFNVEIKKESLFKIWLFDSIFNKLVWLKASKAWFSFSAKCWVGLRHCFSEVRCLRNLSGTKTIFTVKCRGLLPVSCFPSRVFAPLLQSINLAIFYFYFSAIYDQAFCNHFNDICFFASFKLWNSTYLFILLISYIILLLIYLICYLLI